MDSEVRLCPTPSSADKRNSNVVLVSTLDGKLTALDPNDEGRMLWSIDTKPGDMVSSTIRSLLLAKDKPLRRLINLFFTLSD